MNNYSPPDPIEKELKIKSKKSGFKYGLMGLAIGCIAYAASVLPSSTYILHKVNYGIERRLGDVICVKEDPGFYFKDKFYIPFFSYLTTVERLDKRILEYIDSAEKIMTRDHKFIDSDRYCKWRIKEPRNFVNFVRTEKRAQSLLDDIVFNKVWNKVASHTFEENQTTMRKQIRDEMVQTGNELMKRYGIEIIDIRIKKLNIPEEARPKIHERMKAEQYKMAAQERAKGEQKKREILGKKEQVVKTLQAEAKNQIETILGQAERQVAEIYNEAYGKDMDFYKFWERMSTYDTLAESHPTLILSPDHPLFDDPIEKKKD